MIRICPSYTISKNDCLIYGCYACLEIPHKLEVYATLKRHYILEMVLHSVGWGLRSESLKRRGEARKTPKRHPHPKSLRKNIKRTRKHLNSAFRVIPRLSNDSVLPGFGNPSENNVQTALGTCLLLYTYYDKRKHHQS